MADNETELLTEILHQPSKYLGHLVYIVEGLFMVIGNLLISVTIILFPRLRIRKELLIVAGLAGGDLIYGVGILYAGCRRLFLVLAGRESHFLTHWECMKEIQSVFFIIGPQMVAMMIIFLSIDRFMAVVCPGHYRKLTRRYSCLVVSGCFTFASFSYVVALIDSRYYTNQTVRSLPALCFVTWTTNLWYSVYLCMFSVLAGVISCVIYVFVAFAYKVRVRKLSPRFSSLFKHQLRRQRKLTQTLGLITFFTLIFYAVPFSVVALTSIFQMDVQTIPQLYPYLANFFCLNSILNVLIFVYNQKEVRKRMTWLVKFMFCVTNHLKIIRADMRRNSGLTYV